MVEEKLPEGVVFMDKETGIVTTQEEIDAYNIIRSILRQHIDVQRITYKDNKSYFVVNLDGGYWWICRLVLGTRKKLIYFPMDNYKSNEAVGIESIDDIFKYVDRLVESLKIATKE